MTNLVRQRIDRVKQELEMGNRPGEIAMRLAGEWKVSARTVERMMQSARGELYELWKMEQEFIVQKRQKKVAEREEMRFKYVEEIEDALMSIVTGKARVNKDFRNQGRWSSWDVAPDFDQIIKAAEAYRRRESKRIDSGQLTMHNDSLRTNNYGLRSDIENHQPQTNSNSPNGPTSPTHDERKEKQKEPINDLPTTDYELRTDIENEEDDTMMWYESSEEDVRKLEEFEKHRDYEGMTPEEVDWMMTEIKGYWPNLPIAISLEEPIIRERVFAKRIAEKKAEEEQRNKQKVAEKREPGKEKNETAEITGQPGKAGNEEKENDVVNKEVKDLNEQQLIDF